MRDKEDGFAFFRKFPHRCHEFVDLLRGEDRRGLVEDQDIVVAVQHLEYLYPLLHADGDILHLGVQIHLETVFFGQGFHLCPGFLFLQEAQLRGLRAQDDVVQDREDFHELKVLMHHSYSQRGGVVGVFDLHLFAVEEYLSFFRLVEAEEHAHERGFSRAVLPQQGVYLAAPKLQRDVVVGLDAGEFLGYVQHFYYIIAALIHSVPVFPD